MFYFFIRFLHAGSYIVKYGDIIGKLSSSGKLIQLIAEDFYAYLLPPRHAYAVTTNGSHSTLPPP